MGVFSRMTDIIQANVNAALDKAEDPEKLVRLMIQEMEETVVEIRSTSAAMIAQKKTLTRELNNYQGSVTFWLDKANHAIEKGRDDLAKAALQEKHKASQAADTLSTELNQIEENLTKLNHDLEQLQKKLAQAKTKQKQFQQRQQSAATRIKIKTQLHSEQIAQAFERFEQVERKVDEIEAQVESYEIGQSQSLHSQFENLETENQIDQELAELKAKQHAA